MESFGIIYKVTNKVNGKSYIGQTTCGLDNRKRCHISDASTDRYNSVFHRAIRKYGIDNFIWEVLEVCDTLEELSEMELHYIIQYNSLREGYNMCYNVSCQAGKLNPNYGNTMSDDSKNRISQFNKNRYKDKKNHPWYGRHHKESFKEKMKKSWTYRKPVSEETRMKMSEAHSGKRHTEATRLKCSLAKIGKNNPFYGKHLSDGHKEKLSKAFTGSNNPFYGKKHSEETKARMRKIWAERKARMLEAK